MHLGKSDGLRGFWYWIGEKVHVQSPCIFSKCNDKVHVYAKKVHAKSLHILYLGVLGEFSPNKVYFGCVVHKCVSCQCPICYIAKIGVYNQLHIKMFGGEEIERGDFIKNCRNDDLRIWQENAYAQNRWWTFLSCQSYSK